MLMLICRSSPAAQPVVAIIIDDLGYRYTEGLRAARLPGPVACAVIPNAPHAVAMATAAHRHGKEVLVHLPMQPVDAKRAVGSEGITLDTTRSGLRRLLRSSLEGVPHATGVNNHMGSLITRHPGHMTWLMKELRGERLFFIDSVTTGSSVALAMAQEQGVPSAGRDIFLDDEQMTESEIDQRLERLFERARRQGYALGIAHPYPATIALLERRLESLSARGIRLVTVAELIQARSRMMSVAAGGYRHMD